MTTPEPFGPWRSGRLRPLLELGPPPSSSAYAPAISDPTDDLAAQLERLYEEQPKPPSPDDVPWPPPEPEPPSTRRAPAADAPTVVERAVPDVRRRPGGFDGERVLAEIHQEMDTLHTQLDAAFEEVIARVERLELRVGALVRRSEAHGEAAEATAKSVAGVVERLSALCAALDVDAPILDERFALLARTLEHSLDQVGARPVSVDLTGIERAMQHLSGSVDASLAASRLDAAPRLSAVEEGLRRLGALVEQSTADARSSVGADLTAVEKRFAELSARVDDRLAEGRAAIEQGLAGVRRVLRTMHEQPGSIDMTAIEEAARRAALPNAADLAHARQEIAALSDAVRQQDFALNDLRASLELIKQRIL